MIERRINRRRQGDLGETSAIEWLTRVGATVFTPVGHSPDSDLIAELDGSLLRIQVKTSSQIGTTLDGHRRYPVALSTCGGNQSWNRRIKWFDPSRVDYLFALTAEGRRWFIPSPQLEARNAVTLGGPKYAEFEIDRTESIHEIVYANEPSLESPPAPGGVPKRSNGRGCKPRGLAPSQVRILPPPSTLSFPEGTRLKTTHYERKLGQSGRAVINQKRRVTLPQAALVEAELMDGDCVQAHALGPGRIVLEKTGLPVWAEPVRRLRLAEPA